MKQNNPSILEGLSLKVAVKAFATFSQPYPPIYSVYGRVRFQKSLVKGLFLKMT